MVFLSNKKRTNIKTFESIRKKNRQIFCKYLTMFTSVKAAQVTRKFDNLLCSFPKLAKNTANFATHEYQMSFFNSSPKGRYLSLFLATAFCFHYIFAAQSELRLSSPSMQMIIWKAQGVSQ